METFFLPSSTIAHIFTALIIPWKNSMYNGSADRCWTIAASLTAQLYLFFITLDSNWYRFNCGSYQREPFNSNSSPEKLAFFPPITWLLILETDYISPPSNYLYVYWKALRFIFQEHGIWNKIDLNFNLGSSVKLTFRKSLNLCEPQLPHL